MNRLLVLIIFFICLIPFKAESLLKKGDIAPDFLITDSENRRYNLYQFREKVILIQFLSTKCFACDYVIPDINRLYERFNKNNVKIMGILFNDEIDSPVKLKEFIENRQIKYPVYFTDKKIKKPYNIFGFPNFFILNEKKKIRQIFRGITKDTFGLLHREIENLLIERK